MTRLVIYASYDNQGIVHDYVISYLKRLKRIADKIIFIADNKAKAEEKQKLNGLVEFCDFAPHGEYDFGSYKRGYQYASKQGLLEEADELILCNDSCFSVMDFDQMFSEMNQRDCDFWGVTDSLEIQHHLQSYFLVFKKNVFTHQEFANWLGAVTHKNDFREIVKTYEVPLKSFLEKLGFKGESFIKAKTICNQTEYPITLIHQKAPLLKRKVFVIGACSKESVRGLLIFLKQDFNDCYRDICNYFKTTFNRIFPLILPRDLELLKRLFYQNKITKSGKSLIKICKIPLPINFFRKKGLK